MTEYVPQIVVKGDICTPKDPIPTPVPTPQNECVEQITLTGSVTANCECCCPRLRTRTLAHQYTPQQSAAMRTAASGTLNAWEAAGFVILGHSLVQAGPAVGGWVFIWTVGWYI
jgi:hypothetical protein